jgi:hypothetical protein
VANVPPIPAVPPTDSASRPLLQPSADALRAAITALEISQGRLVSGPQRQVVEQVVFGHSQEAGLSAPLDQEQLLLVRWLLGLEPQDRGFDDDDYSMSDDDTEEED